MSKGSSQSGFTLIELLVSLALLGLMMSLIGLAVPLAMKAAGRTSMLSDEISAIETAQHLLRRQIGEMPVYLIQQGYDRRVLFTGQPDRMRFPANPVAAQGHDGPRLIDLEIASSGQGAAAGLYGRRRGARSGCECAAHRIFLLWRAREGKAAGLA